LVTRVVLYSDLSSNSCTMCFYFIGALVASNLMDKQGRKKLLIGSYLGMVCAMETFMLW
jgi:MFS family permease